MFYECNFLLILFILPLLLNESQGFNKYTRDDLLLYREEVRTMFNHAYSGYLNHEYPYDELRPLTCDGVDTWGSYSLTLIDALSTLIILGNYTEFQRVVSILTDSITFDVDINVSVFETNIRVIGGLLSAHMLSHKTGMTLESGWPCNGPLLRLAENVANRLLPAFDTPTGMPYGTVNLIKGVPPGETTITCTAGIGTFILEFGTLSRLTGDPVYEEVAMNAIRSLFQYQSKIGLVGNHIDVMTGVWTAQDSGIGSGIDSYFEYLVKGALLFNKPELMSMFLILEKSVNKYLKHNDWFFWVSMQKGLITLPLFQSLESYYPGVLSFIGNMNESIKSLHNYHTVWKRYGFTPELFNIIQQEVSTNRESYPLRPELIESVMYLYRATGDPYLLDIGVDILKSIQHSAVTSCGYATIKDCRDHTLDNRMESFFLAETTKYLYLLFDPNNFIHNRGEHGRVFETTNGRKCVIDAGGYVFNTEAHPIDPGMLRCCSKSMNDESAHEKFEEDFDFLGKSIDGLKHVVSSCSPADNEFLVELSDLFTHVEMDNRAVENHVIVGEDHVKSDRLENSAPTIRKQHTCPQNNDICSREDHIKYTFSAKKRRPISSQNCNFERSESASDFEMELDIASFKEYLLNKTEFTGEDYDAQLMIEKIIVDRKQKNVRSFLDFNLLTCKPQPFVQRLSFFGQFFSGP
jgi:mannosidase alpha-like ER degradation enhancer 2